MKTHRIEIGKIPALLWGEPTGRLLVAVHGSMSHKADTVIELLAQQATRQGYQVLSFDLPEHGERKTDPTLCKAQICVEELGHIMAYAKNLAPKISLFGCSLGAAFSLLAYCRQPIERALFLSPVVDMGRLIENMMSWFSISHQELQARGEIPTPMGQTLYWDYYQYIKGHPVCRWPVPTHILYPGADALCERQVIEAFTERFGCQLSVLEGGEHFFHTPEQLAYYQEWLAKSL